MDKLNNNISKYRKRNSFVIGLMIFLGVFSIIVFDYQSGLSGYVTGPGGCIYPEEDLLLDISATLCSGTYYLNDSNLNGAIQVDDSDIIITCDNTTLIGNNQGTAFAASFSGYNGATIKNCIIKNYSTGILISTTDSWSVINNTIENTASAIMLLNYANNCNISNNNISSSSNKAIWGASTSNSEFVNNTIDSSNISIYVANGVNSKNNRIISNTLTDSQSGGIILHGCLNCLISENSVLNSDNSDDSASEFIGIGSSGIYGEKNNFTLNVVNGFGMGISVDFSDSNIISQNNISNTGVWGINTRSNNTIISNNRIINSSWNLIHFDEFNHEIYNNYLENYKHHGIDSHNTKNYVISGDSNIYSNTITQTSSQYSQGDIAIFLSGSKNNNIYYNNLINIIDNDTAEDATRGIAIEGGDYSFGNNVYNNTLTNISGVCIYDDSHNTTYSYNTFYNCISNYSINVFGAWDRINNITKSIFKYNTDLTKTLKFVLSMNNRINISIYEDKPFRIKAGIGSGTVNFYLNQPYNDIYNESDNHYIMNNTENSSHFINIFKSILIDDLIPDPDAPNNPPATPTITLSTENATNLAEQDLDCEAIITDPDNNNLNATVYWYKNEIFNHSTSYNNDYESGTNFKASLDKSYTQIGDGWYCGIILSDGENNSQEGVSNGFIITDTSGVQYDTYQNNNSNPYVNDSVNFSLHVFSDNNLDSYIFEINNETNISNTINSNDASISQIINITQEGVTCIRFFINNSVNKTNTTDYSCVQSTIYVEPSNIIYSGLSISPSEITTGDDVTIEVSVTNNKILEDYTLYDNFTGSWAQTTNTINQTNTSISITKSTIVGNNCAWFEFRDVYNQTNETSIICATATDISNQNTGGSSGGGGSSLGATATVEENVIEEVTQIEKEESKVLIVDVKDGATEKITVNLKKSSLSKNIKVSTIEKPQNIPELQAQVYKFIEISHDEIPDEDITSVVKSFKVEKEWLTNNNLNKQEIKLFRYTDKWSILPTYITTEDDIYVHYEAQSPGLSIFAIGAEKDPVIIKEEIEEPKEIIKDPIESKRPYFAIITLLLIGFLIGIMIWVKQDYKPIKLNQTQEQVTKYVEDALNAGYHKLAIRHILKKKGVQENLIKFAFKQLKTTKPTIRHKKPVNAHLSPETFENVVNQLVPYIKKERDEGYYLHEIEEALIHYGHDYSTIKEAMKRVKNERS